MMLDDKGADEPQPFGLDIVFDEVAETLRAVELRLGARSRPPRRRAAEQPEPGMVLAPLMPLCLNF